MQLLGVRDRDEARQLAIEYGVEGVERRPRRPLPGVHRTGPGAASNQGAKPEGARAAYKKSAETPTRRWLYRDAKGEVVGRVSRYDLPGGGKEFVQEHPVGPHWAKGRGTKPFPLFRLPDVLARSRKGQRVIIVEGEKCCDALDQIGVFATTAPGGGNVWEPENIRALRGARVVIFADCDRKGRLYALRVAQELYGAGVDVAMPIDIAPYHEDGFDIYDELAEVAATIRADPPDVPADVLRYRIRWMLLDHVYVKYLSRTLPAHPDAIRDKIERLDADEHERPILPCRACGRERVHRRVGSFVYCPCGAFQVIA